MVRGDLLQVFTNRLLDSDVVDPLLLDLGRGLVLYLHLLVADLLEGLGGIHHHEDLGVTP